MTSDPRVDAYLAVLPDDQRKVLQRLRAQVVRLVPEAAETISYGMPAFSVDGRVLLYFAAWKKHCAVYPLTETFADTFAEALTGYRRTKGSLHFAPDHPLPEPLVEHLVRARLADLRAGRG